jgi:hypothetical protein
MPRGRRSDYHSFAIVQPHAAYGLSGTHESQKN